MFNLTPSSWTFDLSKVVLQWQCLFVENVLFHFSFSCLITNVCLLSTICCFVSSMPVIEMCCFVFSMPVIEMCCFDFENVCYRKLLFRFWVCHLSKIAISFLSMSVLENVLFRFLVCLILKMCCIAFKHVCYRKFLFPFILHDKINLSFHRIPHTIEGRSTFSIMKIRLFLLSYVLKMFSRHSVCDNHRIR